MSVSGSTATATSPGYTATATGTDYWVATFNGDSNNAAVTSGATAEPVTSRRHPINTSQQPASADVGESIATRPRSPAGQPQQQRHGDLQPVQLGHARQRHAAVHRHRDGQLSGSTATATSAGYTATATGTDYWVATFNGDSNNAAVTSGATAEPVTSRRHAGDQHQPAAGQRLRRQSIADKATVTRPGQPQQQRHGDLQPVQQLHAHSGTPLFTDTRDGQLSGSTATATSAGYTTTATGTDYWVATFNGDRTTPPSPAAPPPSR